MSRKDFTQYIGETWTIYGVVNDDRGNPVDMKGGAIEFRLASADTLLLKLSTPDEIIIRGGIGEYELEFAADDQRQDQLTPGIYFYEVDAITSDGGVSVQNTGKITVLNSLRKRFP